MLLWSEQSGKQLQTTPPRHLHITQCVAQGIEQGETLEEMSRQLKMFVIGKCSGVASKLNIGGVDLGDQEWDPIAVFWSCPQLTVATIAHIIEAIAGHVNKSTHMSPDGIECEDQLILVLQELIRDANLFRFCVF